MTVELCGGVAAATGPVRLGDGLWRVGLDQTSPVNQTGKHRRGRVKVTLRDHVNFHVSVKIKRVTIPLLLDLKNMSSCVFTDFSTCQDVTRRS